MKLSEIELPTDRRFGFFFSTIFIIIGLYLFNAESIFWSYSFFSLAVLLFLVALIKAELLHPLNKLWMMIGALLGMFISPIVLGIIFYLLFTPLGLIMRIFGRDELRLKLNKNKSHWKKRETNDPQLDNFRNQF